MIQEEEEEEEKEKKEMEEEEGKDKDEDEDEGGWGLKMKNQYVKEGRKWKKYWKKNIIILKKEGWTNDLTGKTPDDIYGIMTVILQYINYNKL